VALPSRIQPSDTDSDSNGAQLGRLYPNVNPDNDVVSRPRSTPLPRGKHGLPPVPPDRPIELVEKASTRPTDQ
jgi:hypothetical protein